MLNRIFSFLLFVSLLTNTVLAVETQYDTKTIQIKANELCARYSGAKEVYVAPTGGGGGGTVPTSLPTLEAILKSIERYVALTGNELRQQNLLKYCEEYNNMAAAAKKLSDQVAKELKTLADKCYTDERCQLSRAFQSRLEFVVSEENKYPVYDREIKKLLLTLNEPRPSDLDKLNIAQIKKCEQYFNSKFVPIECLSVPTSFDVQMAAYNYERNKIFQQQEDISKSFSEGRGVMGSRPCIKTKDGSDPGDVPWYDKNCLDYRIQPSTINEEALRQITALPYTQAFSPSSILGTDGVIDNINTRVRQGNLADPDISSNFGSISGGGTNPITGVGGGGGVTPGTDMKTVEPNYNKIRQNIDVITKLYDAGRIAYASSTSICKNLPVATRAKAITNIDTAKKSYTDYKKDLETKWEAAKSKPNENHTALIVKINFDLKDIYNQKLIDDTLEIIKKLLKICQDASVQTS